MTNHTPGKMVCHGNEMIQEEAGVTLAYFGANGTYGEKSYRITDVEAAANAEYAARAWNLHDALLCYAKECLQFMEWSNAPQDQIDALKALIAEAEGGGDG